MNTKFIQGEGRRQGIRKTGKADRRSTSKRAEQKPHRGYLCIALTPRYSVRTVVQRQLESPIEKTLPLTVTARHTGSPLGA